MAGQSFSVINNINSYAAQQNLGFSRMGMDSSLAKMSSGLRINEAGDDAAGLAIGSALKADYTALSQGVRNANEGMGIVQVADGALSRMNDMLARATQLATQAASGTVGTQKTNDQHRIPANLAGNRPGNGYSQFQRRKPFLSNRTGC